MNTYLFKDATHYKIGKSLDVNRRFLEMRPYNPTLTIVTSINENIEALLHIKYKKNRVKGEWFVFTEKEVQKLIEDDFKNPTVEEILYKNYIIQKGKHKNKHLISLFEDDEINWLKSFNNEAFNYWLNNYTRYYFLRCQIENLTVVTNYTEYKEKHQMINDLKLILKTVKLSTIETYSKTENITYNGAKRRVLSGVVDTVCISGKTLIIH